MKIFKEFIVILLMASLSWAADVENKPAVPCVHSGSFFSVGLGVSYESMKTDLFTSHHNESGHFDRTDGYVTDYLEVYGPKKYWEFSGFEAPSIDIRFGGAFANTVALYFTFAGGLYRGEAVREEKNISQIYNADQNGNLVLQSETIKSDYKRTFDAVAAYGWFGLGFSVYPFHDPNSPMKGVYFGFSGGLDIMGVRVEENFDDVVTESFYTRYEIGRDWWVSETWSIGVALAYTRVIGFEDDYYNTDGGSRNAFTLLFRITRG